MSWRSAHLPFVPLVPFVVPDARGGGADVAGNEGGLVAGSAKRGRSTSTTSLEFDDFYKTYFTDYELYDTSGPGQCRRAEEYAGAFINAYQQLSVVVANALTIEQAKKLLVAIYATGMKELVRWAHDETNLRQIATLVEVCRPASREWWRESLDPLLLTREMDQSVIVDLWHARVGTEMQIDNDVLFKPSFARFKTGSPTFFMHSLSYMHAHLENLHEYLCDNSGESVEDQGIYVKKGRFQFHPLLWFDDVNVKDLSKDVRKRPILTQMIQSHAAANGSSPDAPMQGMDDEAWQERAKRSLYKRTKGDGKLKCGRGASELGPELRLDNNQVNKANLALSAGYQGTLCADISGVGALSMPHHLKTHESVDTLSIVLWDVPGTLISETDWQELGSCAD